MHKFETCGIESSYFPFFFCFHLEFFSKVYFVININHLQKILRTFLMGKGAFHLSIHLRKTNQLKAPKLINKSFKNVES